MKAAPLHVVSTIYFFAFSPPSSVFAVNPARAATSIKSTRGAEAFAAARPLAPGFCWPETEIPTTITLRAPARIGAIAARANWPVPAGNLGDLRWSSLNSFISLRLENPAPSESPELAPSEYVSLRDQSNEALPRCA